MAYDTEGFLNYIRLDILLHEGAIPLRLLFQDLHKELTNQKWDNTKKCANKFINSFGRHYYKDAQQIQKELLREGNVAKWDISMLIYIIISITKEFSEADFNNMKFKKCNLKNLKILAHVRNQHFHLGNKSLANKEFLQLWSEARDALVDLGGDSQQYAQIQKATNLHGLFKPSVLSIEKMTSQAQKLRQDGNGEYKNQNFQKAITIYSEALSMKGISDVEMKLLYSNRSSAYLQSLAKVTCQKQIEEDSLMAAADAESVIKLEPTWWKGYYRLGCVYKYRKEWENGQIAFSRSLGLDPSQSQLKQHLEECRYENSRDKTQQHLDPRTHYASREVVLREMAARTKDTTPWFDDDDKFINFIPKPDMESADTEETAYDCMTIGHLYNYGTEVPVDYKKAAHWYSKAASLGNAEGLYNLGVYYQWGRGVQRSFSRAVDLYEKAAKCPMTGRGFRNLSVGEAEYALGTCYRDGVGKKQNFEKAVRWYTRSCESGFGEAANNLGILYHQGLGVSQNWDKAKQLYTVAAHKGVVLAMENLANMALDDNNPDEALFWFQRSLKGKNMSAMINQQKFETKLSEVRKKSKKIEMQDNNHNSESLLKILGALPNSTSLSNMCPVFFDYIEEINTKSAHEKSYPFTQIVHSAFHSYLRGHELVIHFSHKKPQNLEAAVLHKILSEFANFGKATDIMFQLVPDIQTFLKKIVKHVFTGAGSDGNSQVDLDARICHVILYKKSFKEIREFLAMCKLKYPHEVYFHEVHCWMFFQEDHRHENKEDEKVVLESLKMFPNSAALHYWHAAMWRNRLRSLSQTDVNEEEFNLKLNMTKKAYLSFLEAAPRDHRRVPEAFYWMSLLSLSFIPGKIKGGPESLKFYREGLKSEENLLSCFLPYESVIKMTVESFLLDNMDEAKRIDNSSREVKSLPGQKLRVSQAKKIPELQLTNPNRIYIVRRHREILGEEMKKQEFRFVKINYLMKTPLQQQHAPSRSACLKEISLIHMMNEGKDHVYKNFVLNITIMEDCLFGLTKLIQTTVCDEKGDFHKLYIYNVDHKDSKMRRALSFGSTLSIQNPYFHLFVRGDTGIRVDDPKSLVFHTSGMEEPKCRFCGGSSPKNFCSRCKRAKYCSKECQKEDWVRLKHNFICDAQMWDML